MRYIRSRLAVAAIAAPRQARLGAPPTLHQDMVR